MERELICVHHTAAKAALRRKKVHERSLEQTDAQIAQVEQQIYSIEAANINQETLNAMKTAGKAMKDIHGNLTIDKVDETMYVTMLTHHNTLPFFKQFKMEAPLLTHFFLSYLPGKNFANSTPSAKRSPLPSPAPRSANQYTKQI